MYEDDPRIHIDNETIVSEMLFKEFQGLVTTRPDTVLWAIDKLERSSYDVPDEAQDQAISTINDLLDETDNGFNIDYDNPAFIDQMRTDQTYGQYIRALRRTERDERTHLIRAMALRGLWLYVEKIRYSGQPNTSYGL